MIRFTVDQAKMSWKAQTGTMWFTETQAVIAFQGLSGMIRCLVNKATTHSAAAMATIISLVDQATTSFSVKVGMIPYAEKMVPIF